MPIYFSWFITALLFGKWWSQQSQPTAKWAPFILRDMGMFRPRPPMRRHLERDLQPAAEISHMLLPGNAKSALFRQGAEEIDDFRRFPVDRTHNFASQHAVCVDDVAFGNLNCSVKMLHF